MSLHIDKQSRISEGYSAKSSAFNGIDSIGRNAPDAKIVMAE